MDFDEKTQKMTQNCVSQPLRHVSQPLRHVSQRLRHVSQPLPG
jgi:hypothetical protein